MRYSKSDLLLREPNIYKAFLILAMPVFFSNFLSSIHDIVDTYFIGQIANSVPSQAAISISWPIFNILLSVNAGLAVAGVSIISRRLGARNKEDAKKYGGAIFLCALFFGGIINIILFVGAPTFLSFAGASGDVLECATIYLRARSFETIPIFVFAVFQSMRHSTGDTTTPVLISCVSITLNIILTYICVKIYNMGILGAGVATAIAQGVMTPLVIFLLFRQTAPLFIEPSDMRIDKEHMSVLSKIALPAVVGQIIGSFGFLILNAIILEYGPEVVAAFSNGNKVSNLLSMPMNAIGSVQAAYIGQNIGADNKERTFKAYTTGRNLALMISLAGCFLLLPFKTQAAHLLSNNPLVIEYCVEYLFWIFALQPFMALFQTYIQVFNGCGKTKYSMILDSARLWILRLPLILLFKNFTTFGRFGIWYAMILSNFLILFVGQYLLTRLDFYKNRPHKSKEGVNEN